MIVVSEIATTYNPVEVGTFLYYVVVEFSEILVVFNVQQQTRHYPHR
jgi:hypothetical protein